MHTAPLSDSLAIPSQTECIDDARRWVAAHSRGAGLHEDAVFELELALTEALANVIQHAYGGDAGGTIELSLTIDQQQVELRLLDRGRRFRRSAHRPPDLDQPGRAITACT